MDLVGTCPKTFWKEWLEEGDCAGEPDTQREWSWYTRHSMAKQIKIGDRFYVVAFGKLRGYAIVTDVRVEGTEHWYQIVRQGGAVACTIEEPIPGFQGLRAVWWKREQEKPFENWKDA